MSDSNVDFDERKAALEAELRQVYEAGVAAREDLDRLRGCCEANVGLVHVARLRVARFEVLKTRVMEKIERLAEDVSAGHRVNGGN